MPKRRGSSRYFKKAKRKKKRRGRHGWFGDSLAMQGGMVRSGHGGPKIRRYARPKIGGTNSKGYLRNRNILADGFIATHRYSDTITFSASEQSGTPVRTFAYSANNMFDPCAGWSTSSDESTNTVGGHQPFGRDELTSDFTKYCVVRSKIRITPTEAPTLVSNTAPCWYGIIAGRETVNFCLDGSSSTRNNICKLIEAEGPRKKMLTTEHINSDPYNGSITRHFNWATSYGHNEPLADDITKTAVGSGPTLPWYFTLWWATVAYRSTTIPLPPLRFLVEIEYECAWLHPTKNLHVQS